MAFTFLLNATVYADDWGVSTNREDAYEYAVKVLNEYYYAVDQYMDYDFSDQIGSASLLNYIDKKVETKSYDRIVYGENDKCNYNVDFQLLNKETIGDKTKLSIAVNVEFNYAGADFSSAYGEEVQLILCEDESGYQVLDWYVPYDDYDTVIRGTSQDILKLPSMDSKSKTVDIVSRKQKELDKEIKLYYDGLKEEIKQAETGNYEKADNNVYIDTNDTTYSSRTLYSLNKSNIVTWANNNCTKASPASGNSNQAPYYDFSQISGNYDCTNFVSHAILAGGAVVYNTGGSGISSTGWYYSSLSNRSSSWSGVANLYNFLVSNTTKGPTGTEVAYANVYTPGGSYPYEPGDILQFHNGSIWRHSTIIVGYIAVEGSGTMAEAVVSGRTSKTAYNYKQRQSEINSGQSRRVIKLNGYYK